MARARDPARDKAKEMFLESKGEKLLKDIAAELGKSDVQIRKWKNLDKWDDELKGNVTNQTKGNVPKQKVPEKKVVESEEIVYFDAEGEDGLTDKQRLFCMYYIKTYNQTMAAIKAGYSKDRAHITGSELVRNSKVGAEIKRLKGEQRKGIFLDAMDVLDKYIQIAFADITDYLTFGREEVDLIGAFGPVKDEDGKVIQVERDYVRFNESVDVDGTLITSVKQGRDGIAVQFADKMKALEFLAKHFDLLGEKERQKLHDEKLKAETTLIQARVRKENGEEDEYEDDGFLDALGNAAATVWEGETDD